MTAARHAFSIFVLVLVVAPIPPSTIIGVALMSSRHTRRFMAPWSVIAIEIVQKAPGRAYVSFRRRQYRVAKIVVTEMKAGKRYTR